MKPLPAAIGLVAAVALGFGAARLVVRPEFQPVAPPQGYQLPVMATPVDAAESRSETSATPDAVRAAADYLELLPDDPHGRTAHRLALQLFENDPGSAIEWAARLPEGSAAQSEAYVAIGHRLSLLLDDDGFDAFWNVVMSTGDAAVRAKLIAGAIEATFPNNDVIDICNRIAPDVNPEAAAEFANAIATERFQDPSLRPAIDAAMAGLFTRIKLIDHTARTDTSRPSSAQNDWAWLTRLDDPLTHLEIEREIVRQHGTDHPTAVIAEIQWFEDSRRRYFLLEELTRRIPVDAARVLHFDSSIEKPIADWLVEQPERTREEFARAFLATQGDHLSDDVRTALATLVQSPRSAAAVLKHLESTTPASQLVAKRGDTRD